MADIGPLLRVSQATMKIPTGLHFIWKLYRGRMCFQAHSCYWWSLFPRVGLKALAFCWLLARGQPQIKRDTHSSLLHGFLNMAPYSIKPARRNWQSAKTESGSKMWSQWGIFCHCPHFLLVRNVTYSGKGVAQRCGPQEWGLTGSPLGSVCHMCQLEDGKHKNVNQNKIL